MYLTTIEKVKKEDFLRLPGGKKVYINKGYCRINKKYEVQDFSDMSNWKYFKKGRQVEIDFEF